MAHAGSTADALAELTKTVAAGGGGGGGVSDGDKGDITVSGGGTVWAIDAGVVSTTKLGGDITTAGKALLDDADAAAQRATLGLGTAATTAATDYAAAVHSHAVFTSVANGYAPASGGGTANFLRADGTWAAPAGGGSATISSATVTVPYGSGDYLATVTDASVSGSSKIILAPGLYARTDENEPSDADMRVESVGTGSFGVRLTSMGRERIGGAFKIFYLIG